MADRSSSKTFGDLMLALAEAPVCGIASYGTTGTGVGALPTGEADLAILKRAVNRGYQRFLNFYPQWSFMRDEVTMTVSQATDGPYNVRGAAWRYRLPSGVRSAPIQNMRFSDATALVSRCKTVDSRLILDLRQRSDTSGTPQFAAFRPIQGADGAGDEAAAFEMILYPTPDTTYTMSGQFRLLPYDMVDEGERHIAGAAHDRAIIACVLYEWARMDQDKEPMTAGLRDDMLMALAESVAIDKLNRPIRRGPVTDGGGDGDLRERKIVTLMDGVSIPGDA
jgi:hypothetical protein